MSETFIRAIERTEKPKKARRDGFAPGVIYGEGYENGLPVKFEMLKLKRILKKQGQNTKIWIKIGEQTKYGVIKDIQRDPITGDIVHIDIQTISQNDDVKLKLPIVFTGRNKLEERKLLLQVLIPEIEVLGKASELPEFITIDVSGKKSGEKITVNDIRMTEQIRVLSDTKDVLAIVIEPKELSIAS
ncbi:MAG: ribosomal protein [Clostridia bacterium]|jgi:large subunit ribosomal protein L25|uniref:50S ribosomal protein L25 n=1 Tax=Petroclostridium xylanilyticum TaxID=1792311 RepID=UPI000B992BD0|nr:50S ribosomal protein L25 [Petroclostridium xylanilyticum]MBZ4647133.1 ribosomal protein [Clostridia bacterium]